MTNTFEYLYLRYKEKFIYNHGQAKFNTIEEKVCDSVRIERLFSKSIQQRTDPSQADFGVAIQTTTYFILAGSDTSAMAEFIAVHFWNDTVNCHYHLCSEHTLYFKGESILKKWGKFYESFK